MKTTMLAKRYWYRAVGVGVFTFFTGLTVYTGVPTSFDQLWGPFVQGVLATLAALGLNVATRSKKE